MVKYRVLLLVFIPLALFAGRVAFAQLQYIEGYTDKRSYMEGDTIVFHVSTTSPTYTIAIIRDSTISTTINTITNLPGTFYPTPADGWLGADWPASYSLVVPGSWPPGSYYANFKTEDGTTTFHPFIIHPVVRGSTSRLAFVLDFTNRNAYSEWGGKSLYVSNIVSDTKHAVKTSFLRPFGDGNGAFLRQHYFVSWLEQAGFAPEYITEWDIHSVPGLLLAYDVVVFAFHDEYISRNVYDALESHHRRGGHLAFFSANDIWWQIRYEDGGDTLVGYRDMWAQDPMNGVDDQMVTAKWRSELLNRPAEALQGVFYQENSYEFQPEDYLVQDSTHWAFSGTNLLDGQPLGAYLASGETDYIGPASPPIMDVLLKARRDVPMPGHTPPIPYVDAAAVYYEDSPAYGFPNGHGGQVFAGGTTDWYFGIKKYAAVRTFSRNIIQHMLNAPSPRPVCYLPLIQR